MNSKDTTAAPTEKSPKNLLIFITIGVILLLAVFLGVARRGVAGAAEPVKTERRATVPYLGPVQVLNGCGAVGAGEIMADFLRSRNFDVKNIGNAPERNYPFTLVIARTKNMTVARQITDSLPAGRCMLLRNGDTTYQVTVIIGSDYPDYKERLQ